jgi:Cytochrome C oxidase, cbb3-type, subunit III
VIDRNVVAMNGKFWQRRSEAMRHTLTILTVCCIGWANAAWSADYAAMSGEDLYRRFCASCHGIEGRGDGPVAASLRVEVPDLTLIARRGYGGELRDRIIRIIDGRYVIGAHGTRVMPVWGEDLARLELGNPDAERSAQVIIGRLADHVRSLQRPQPTDSGEQR